jgi:hypothetical protein
MCMDQERERRAKMRDAERNYALGTLSITFSS